jgi:hypothetical protein
LKRDRLTSNDNGKTFSKYPRSHTVFGAYYFYSDYKWDSKRVARNWFDLFSDIGGLYSAIFVLFQYVASTINEKKWISKQIRQLFIKANQKGQRG